MKITTLNEYLNLFGVNTELIGQVISEALAKGGDYCDIFFEYSLYDQIGLEDQEVNRAYSNLEFGAGIRVLNGYQTGYSFTELIDAENLKLAAKTASNIANDSKSRVVPFFSEHKPADYYKIQTPWEKVEIDLKIPYLQRINKKVFELDKRIIKTNISFNNSTRYILFANSEGRITYDYQPMSQIAVSCIAGQDGKKEQNGFNLAGRQGIEFFTDENLDRLAKEAVHRTVSLFEATKPNAGEMEVVLSAGSSGILLHEAIGHGMEADFNRKGISIFADKIGKKVAENFVTIVDDGTNPNVRGSINVDDEGNDSEKTYLVENGIMKSYLHDKLSAQYYKVKPTGNGRRESFRYMPLPRMRNTYMLPGPHKRDEIIASVKKGIIAESFTNGQVMIGGGDFTFYVKSGFLIENGKIQRPVKDVNIIGNGPEVLKNIVMVADDFQMTEGGWTCGKEGQGVPVSMGLPTVKVSKITVGGF
ncbi:MAG: TldD/PmbA family protein [Bacteroidales bacterium]